jgi:hypothetical protein
MPSQELDNIRNNPDVGTQHSDYVFCDKSSTNFKRILKEYQFELTVEKSEAQLLWLRKSFKRHLKKLLPHQLINHFPNQSIMINKGRLGNNLRQFEAWLRVERPQSISLNEFYPETFCLYKEEDRERFFSQLPDIDSEDNLWIYKPGNSSSGRGIEVFWRTDALRHRYASPEKRPKGDYEIVQRYIQNPLLLNGRKSEIRVYWLIASLDPLLVFLFDEGTVRLTTLPFQLGDYDNQLIHITNVYQQKRHPNYDPNAVLKWSFTDLDRYLYDNGHVDDTNYTATTLMPQIAERLTYIARASHGALQIGYPKVGECFGLYGADIILDSDLNVFVTEIQKGPGLSYDDAIKRRVIPPMMSEAIAIMLEIRRRRLQGLPLQQLNSRKRFQWMIKDTESPTEPTQQLAQ